MEVKKHIGHAARARMAIAHDGAGSNACLCSLARPKVSGRGATITWFRAEIMSMYGAKVVAEFMAGDHDVPVLWMVVNEGIGECSGKVSGNGVTPFLVAGNTEPCNAATKASCRQHGCKLARLCRHVGLPPGTELVELVACRVLRPWISGRWPKAQEVDCRKNLQVALIDLLNASKHGCDVCA